MSVPWLEMWLYPIGDVGAVEVSDDDGDTWVRLQIPAPLPVSDAIENLRSQLEAHPDLSLTADWYLTPSTGLSMESPSPWRIRLSPTMADLLGFAEVEYSLAGDEALVPDATPMAWHSPMGIGYDAFRPIEHVELREYAHGRSSAYLSRHGRGINLTLHLDVAELDQVLLGPLGTHALTRVYPTLSPPAPGEPWDPEPYGRDHLDGYLDVYPVEVTEFDRPVWGDARLRVPCVVADQAPTLVTGRRYSELAAGLPFGFGFVRVAQIDGIPVLFCEREYDATAPSGYTLDASLVVDTSAKLGSLVDRERTALGQGHSLTLRLLDTAAVRNIFRRPTAVSWLTADVDEAATSLPVQSPSAFEQSGGIVYIGTDAIPYVSYSATAVTGGTRGAYGRALAHDEGTLVTDRPIGWRGRRVRLWYVAVDPTGRIVSSDGEILTDSVLGWTGHVGDDGAPAPRRVRAEWELVCEPIDRRLRGQIGGAVTGKARWSLDDDGRLVVSPNATIRVQVVSEDADGVQGTVEDVVLVPFAGLSGMLSLSRMRDLIAEAWDAARTDTTHLQDMEWRVVPFEAGGPLARAWQAVILARRETGWNAVLVRTNVVEGTNLPMVTGVRDAWTSSRRLVETTSGLWSELNTKLEMRGQVGAAVLEVIVERGDISSLESGGWIEIEGDDRTQILRYDDLEVGEDGVVRVTIAGGYAPDLAVLAADEAAGETRDLSARISWGDQGPLAEVMLRQLQSGGRGDNGDYDTLARGQGYDLADVDETSFLEVCDGLLGSLGLDLQVDSRTSFGELFGGLLTLAERAVVPRPSGDGQEIRLTAVRIGLPGQVSREDAARITDRDLVLSGAGQPAVRPRVGRPAPNKIAVAVRASSRVDEASLVVNDGARLAYQGPVPWEITIYGIDRAQLVGPVASWGLSLFRQGETVQALEVDVVPWCTAYEGDEVEVDLSDVQLWQYSTGTPGYQGAARVIGRLVDPKTHVPTLWLLADGALSTTLMSPSVPVVGYDGTASSPTAVHVPVSYFPVIARYMAERIGDHLRLRVYAPGADDMATTLLCTAVTDEGTHAELAVASVVGDVDLETIVYEEGFEADAGDWIVQSPITRHTGSTTSSSTGPSAAYAGSYYMYYESSAPAAPGDVRVADGPAFSLVDAHAATLTFAWHMYGATMGTMSVQISADRGETWDTVWTRTGDQGNAWTLEEVDLADYLGARCRMRIVCVGGSSWTSDMAWDAITITALRHRLTNPSSDEDQGVTQAAHLHTDQDVVWS